MRCLAPLLLAAVLMFQMACQSYTTGLQQSRARANDTAAISALRTIASAQLAYSINNGGDYGRFEQLVEAGYLDQRFNSDNPVKDYSLTMQINPKSDDAPEPSYSCNADPVGSGPGAGRHFYIDSTSAVIHVNANKPATANDPATQ